MNEIVLKTNPHYRPFLDQRRLEGKLDVCGVLRSRVYPTVADRDTRQRYFLEVVQGFVCCLRTRWSFLMSRERATATQGKARQDGREGEGKGAKEEKKRTYQYKERIDQRSSRLQYKSI